MTSDRITFASAAKHGQKLAKVVHVEDGQIVAIEPAPQAGLHRFRTVEVGELADLMAAVEGGARRGEIAVRGEPLGPVGRRAIYPDAEKGPPGLEVVPRQWVAFDWDGLPIRPHQPEPALPWIADDPAEAWNWALPDPLLDPEVGVATALRRLPPAFRDVGAGWQVTASAAFKPGWRLRTWHWLSQSCTGAELKTWLRPLIRRGMVDDVTLVECQPHYLATTCLGDPDLCPQRFGILEQASGNVVQVPDIAAIARRQQQRDQQERQASRRPQEVQRPRRDQDQDNLERWLWSCVDLVRNAREGHRHPTYKFEACRIKATCDKHGVPWETWRDRVIEAYESTLTAAELKERKTGSIAGVMAWLDRRPAA